jgi:hypothetical protein
VRRFALTCLAVAILEKVSYNDRKILFDRALATQAKQVEIIRASCTEM